jgi:predicted dehydrogenase
VRFCFVGLGEAALGLHVPALACVAGAEIAAGCDPSPERRNAWQRATGATAFETLDELFGGAAPDVVVVATPPDAHADACLRALEMGAHVLCEKPLTASVEEADHVMGAAAAAGRRVAVNHHFRFQPIFRAVKHGIDSGEHGSLVFSQIWQLTGLAPWDEAADWRAATADRALLEGGIHLVDLLLWLNGGAPQSVLAAHAGGPGADPASDAIALVTLSYPEGRLAQLSVNRRCVAATRFAELRADCERASLRASVGGRALLRVGKKRASRGGLSLELAAGGAAWAEQGLSRRRLARNGRRAGMRATAALIAELVGALEAGREPPVTGREARDAVAVVEAAYRSARTGARVELEATDAQAARNSEGGRQEEPSAHP